MIKHLEVVKKTLALVVFSSVFLTGSVASQDARETTATQVKEVTILAVNDIHAALENFPRFAFMVDRLRDSHPDLLLVSAGDNQTGHPANDQYPEKGLPVIELMNALKFDLSAVGNHEFDTGLEGFERE